MTLLDAIVIVLSQLAVPAVDRDEPDRNQRLLSIAISINKSAERATCTGWYAIDRCRPIAADPLQVAAELIELANAETNLRSNVHRGECLPHQCDAHRVRIAGKVVVMHRARSLWQLHRAPAWTTEKWDGLLGATQVATDAAAWEATKLLAGYRTMCGGTQGAFAGYATGWQCSHKQAAGRAQAAAMFRVRLALMTRPTGQ